MALTLARSGENKKRDRERPRGGFHEGRSSGSARLRSQRDRSPKGLRTWPPTSARPLGGARGAATPPRSERVKPPSVLAACTVSMETAEEVTVAGPPRVTPRLAGCRRPDCGLPGAAARVDSTPSSPPPLHSAGCSSPMTAGPNRERRTWAPSALATPLSPGSGTRECAKKHVPSSKTGTCAARRHRGAHCICECAGGSAYIGAQFQSSCQNESTRG
ncbi:uncharacterized protein LOC118918205 [Manis pentadactyla]|uniref:uncharacterized protein LOC118918205 n=1 Tax=Manis pentadactyla TaxID=143292 RepID=UPI00255CCD2D|nr:uncharacterized protein LOC118918205 [Manis pentadactyla]